MSDVSSAASNWITALIPMIAYFLAKSRRFAAGSRDVGRQWLSVVERRGSGDYRSGGLVAAAGLGVARGNVCRPDAARRLAVVEMVVAAGARTKAQR